MACSSVSQVIDFLLCGGQKLDLRLKFSILQWNHCILWIYIMPNQQNLGLILENKKSGNWSYQKMSTVKFVHLNLHFLMRFNLRMIQIIFCHRLWQSNFVTFWGPSILKHNISLMYVQFWSKIKLWFWNPKVETQ